ncbi:MAG: response regulator [Chitinophagales bacterium]|nr:response regulator [Chitinophagales bacterium]
MKKINCILLVDDNESDNFYHKLIIKDANVCNIVKVVSNGIEALEYIEKSNDPTLSDSYPKAELIFLDINMPKMNGFEFLEEYRQLENQLKSKALIIMLTTSLNPDEKARARELKEVTEFQNKPLSIEILNEIVRKYFS